MLPDEFGRVKAGGRADPDSVPDEFHRPDEISGWGEGNGFRAPGAVLEMAQLSAGAIRILLEGNPFSGGVVVEAKAFVGADRDNASVGRKLHHVQKVAGKARIRVFDCPCVPVFSIVACQPEVGCGKNHVLVFSYGGLDFVQWAIIADNIDVEDFVGVLENGRFAFPGDPHQAATPDREPCVSTTVGIGCRAIAPVFVHGGVCVVEGFPFVGLRVEARDPVGCGDPNKRKRDGEAINHVVDQPGIRCRKGLELPVSKSCDSPEGTEPDRFVFGVERNRCDRVVWKPVFDSEDVPVFSVEMPDPIFRSYPYVVFSNCLDREYGPIGNAPGNPRCLCRQAENED